MKKSPRGLTALQVMILFFSLSLVPACVHAQAAASLTDARDGRTYKTAKVGAQTWMAENLRFKVPAGSWAYNDDTVNEANHGRLYNWKAAQAACPKGWHVPSDKEWNALIGSFGGSSEAGQKMLAMDTIGKGKAAQGASAQNAMTSLLGGIRHPDGSCIGITFWGGCWTSVKVNDSVASNVLFVKGSKEMGFSTNDKNAAFSLRCVKK